ncbi:MAG: TetR family transcriptional regulator C-terminal domain-containing protein, partial [Cytophagales bacterium]|nr:TetR family transcriptional regulator C-terminal domain-containing protein [Cytophagales bacterium]
HGFQGVRADKVVADMGITKGALYHHFSSKLDLGYAVVDELLAPSYLSTWRPLETARKNHLQVLVQTLEQFKQRTDDEEVKLGCPLNNLMQEMSPLDEGFRRRLGNIIEKMAYSIETGLRNGQSAGNIRSDADAKQLSLFDRNGLAKRTISR